MRTQRVKELVLKVGNFPWNKSAHWTGCVAQGPRAGGWGWQVAARQPLGSAVQGISKATEHMPHLSLVVQGLPRALGSSWSPYPSAQTTRFFLLGGAPPPEGCLGA